MQYHQYRYFARDEAGRDLFFIELDNSDGLEQMFFVSNIGMNFQFKPELEGMINDFRKSSNSDYKRNELAEKIISEIIQLPDIEGYFFPDYLLSPSGSYLEFADHVVNNIVQNSDFPNFTPFSDEHHHLMFRKLRLLLNDWNRQGRGENVDKAFFLALLPKNEELQHLFVANLSDKMEFVKFQIVDDTQDHWAIYGLFSYSTLAFAFSIHIE